MLYDPERTRGIVDRMVLLGNNLRPFTITLSAVNFGLLFGILGALVFGDSWFVLALVGVIVGFGFGIFLASALAVLLEWMAQVLIRLDTRP
jgi:predicted phage tail protein